MATPSLSKSDRELFAFELRHSIDRGMTNADSLQVILDMAVESLEFHCDDALDAHEAQRRLYALLEAAKNKLTEIGDKDIGRASRACDALCS